MTGRVMRHARMLVVRSHQHVVIHCNMRVGRVLRVSLRSRHRTHVARAHCGRRDALHKQGAAQQNRKNGSG